MDKGEGDRARKREEEEDDKDDKEEQDGEDDDEEEEVIDSGDDEEPPAEPAANEDKMEGDEKVEKGAVEEVGAAAENGDAKVEAEKEVQEQADAKVADDASERKAVVQGEEEEEKGEEEEEKKQEEKAVEGEKEKKAGEGEEKQDDIELPRKKQPFDVPTSGHFYLHDDRRGGDEDEEGEEENARDAPERKKLWAGDQSKWKHDKFEQEILPEEEGSRRSVARRGGRGGGPSGRGGKRMDETEEEGMRQAPPQAPAPVRGAPREVATRGRGGARYVSEPEEAPQPQYVRGGGRGGVRGIAPQRARGRGTGRPMDMAPQEEDYPPLAGGIQAVIGGTRGSTRGGVRGGVRGGRGGVVQQGVPPARVAVQYSQIVDQNNDDPLPEKNVNRPSGRRTREGGPQPQFVPNHDQMQPQPQQQWPNQDQYGNQQWNQTLQNGFQAPPGAQYYMVMPGTDASGQQGTYYFSAPPGQGVPVPMQQYTAPQQYSQQMPRGGPSTGMQQGNMQSQDMQPAVMQAQRGGQVHSRGGGSAPMQQQGFTSLPTGAMPFMPSGSAQSQQHVQQQQDAPQTAKQPPRRYTQMTFANPNQQQHAPVQGGAQAAPSK